MGRSLHFIKLDDEKIKVNLSHFINDNPPIKEALMQEIEWSNRANKYQIDFNEIIDKINNNPQLLNPQEAYLLYYWIFNKFYDQDRLPDIDKIEKEVRKYGFDEFYFCYRVTAESILQELWNFFDPMEQRIFISEDYIYTQKELYNFFSYLCTLTAIFQANNYENTQAWDYLAKNKQYISRALERYNFEQQKQKAIEENEDLAKFYAENEKIFDIIGHNDFFGDYIHLSYSFNAFLEVKAKISQMDPSTRIYIHDSL